MPVFFRLVLLSALVISGRSSLLAEAPTLDGLYPAGGRAGERIEVKATGKELDKNNPVGWCSNPRVTLQPVPLTGDKTKDKALAGLWHITIAKDAPPGPCLIRFHNNADGSSPPRIFEIGTLPEYTEQEPNDSFKQSASASPQAAPAIPTPPLTLNGLLAKEGDADVFPIRVRKGVPLTFELHGYGLGSSMDPAMRLLDERGIELAASHDGHNLDPLIRFTPTSDTTLHIQVHAFVHPPQANIAFKGSQNHIYRLHITESEKSSIPKDAPPPPASSAPPSSPGPAHSAPFTITATLSTPGQESTHSLTAKKGDDLQITVRAKAIRSLLEAVLRIEDTTGKVLQTIDDGSRIGEAGSFSVLDPALRWKVPADGNYRIVVSDRFQSGGPHHHYELSVRPWRPTVTATLAEHAFLLQPGKTADLKLAITIDGPFPEKEKLRARAIGLPAGITCAEAELPAKSGELKLTLKAAADAPAAQAPFSIEIFPSPTATPSPPSTAPTPPPPVPAAITLASYPIPFKDLRGDLLIPTDTHIWLTVPAAPQSAAAQAKPPATAKDK